MSFCGPPPPPAAWSLGQAPDAAAPTEEFTVDENTVAMAPFDKDGVECDTKDAEDLDVTQTLLGLWGGRLPGLEERVTTFACAVDSALLAAWVKQPSPCCAAAALAGAMNALARVGRRDARAMQPLEILATMRGLLRDTVAKKRASFERKLGADLGREPGALGGPAHEPAALHVQRHQGRGRALRLPCRLRVRCSDSIQSRGQHD
mgnify:CR=1 FL=1